MRHEISDALAPIDPALLDAVDAEFLRQAQALDDEQTTYRTVLGMMTRKELDAYQAWVDQTFRPLFEVH